MPLISVDEHHPMLATFILAWVAVGLVFVIGLCRAAGRGDELAESFDRGL